VITIPTALIKKPILILLVAGLLLPLRADECLLNGDFSEGLSHWYGDGELASDVAKELAKKNDPLASAPSAALNPGIVIHLKSSRWSKLTQEFTTNNLKMSLKVNYTLSPDCSFSAKSDYYSDVFTAVGLNGYVTRRLSPGNWAVILTDLGTLWCYYFACQPDKNSSESQTFKADSGGAADTMKTEFHKTITVAFPPGRGNVTVNLISLKN